MSSIGEHIKACRLVKGKPIQEAASLLGIAESHLHKIELGKINPTIDQLIAIANYFDCSEKELLMRYIDSRLAGADRNAQATKRYKNLVQEVHLLHAATLQARIHKPAPPLDTCIESIVYHKGSNKRHPYTRVLPDGVVQLLISLDGHDRWLIKGAGSTSPQALKRSWVTGIQQQHITYRLHGDEITICVRFTPGGFYALTGIPLTEIYDRVIDAHLLFGRSIDLLREQMSESTDIDYLFASVEQYFLSRITLPASENPVIHYVLKKMMEAPLQRIVQKTGYSQKHCIHLFKKHIGLSPKCFQRISRFNKALHSMITNTAAINWCDIVFDHGYFDQPHFVKEFHHFTGLTPTHFIDTGTACTRFLHLDQPR